MLRVKEGNLEALGLLFERHHLPLFGFLFHMTNDRELSEDMVQNVFYRLLKSRHTFTGNGEFRTWMFHIARNLLKDNAKNNKKKGNLHNISGFEEKIGSGETADERILKKQEQGVLNKALETLSPEYREVLILSRFYELKYYEIAQIMNISESAVKVRVHRGLEQLRNVYMKLNTKTEF
jgi:RNA polymerase sigma factor (sigma-70 family)